MIKLMGKSSPLLLLWTEKPRMPIQYDPDAKPPLIKNQRFFLYTCLAIVVVFLIAISAAVGVTLAGRNVRYNITERETSGVREAIETVVRAEKLKDPNSPYVKALNWILYHDPLQLLPSNETFVQRFIIVLFYYSTSVKREWDGGCAPAAHGETDYCTFKYWFEQLTDGEGFFQMVDSMRWLSGTSECSWAGIQCSDDNHIRSIDLSGANMTGTIPDELDQLNVLQFFTVRYNELGGPLPEKLLKLRHLVDLNLFRNQFTGTIPERFFTTPILQRLNLSLNNLNGTISTSIGKMVDAKTLFLAFNKLTGTIPTEIGRLHSLVSVWLHGNSLHGTIPTEIGTLYLVEDLLLNRNQLSGEIPTEIGQLSILGDFQLSENKLKGQIPSQLFLLTRLFNLDLSNNKFSGTIDSAMGNMRALDNLRLQYNDFTGTIPSTLGALMETDNIQVFGNRFNGSIPIEFCPVQRAALGLCEIPRLVADCLPDEDGTPPEIECECCSSCCYRDAHDCEEAV